MNSDMAYLLGMICGNGAIRRRETDTTVSIEIPHKKLTTERNNDVGVYVRASIENIRTQIEPLIGVNLRFIQNPHLTTISITMQNDTYVMREILRIFSGATLQDNFRIHGEIFSATTQERILFLRGLSDVTGYIRRSNYYYEKYMHRVYIEVPRNWFLVIDICNLLESVDIPVQVVDWAHPNIRDGNLTKFNEGNGNFWKKEHQIKIFANEFLPIGFGIIHKHQALRELAHELEVGLRANNINIQSTHKYYWETRPQNRSRLMHPGENDVFIPEQIRGMHFNSWKEIAQILGYRS